MCMFMLQQYNRPKAEMIEEMRKIPPDIVLYPLHYTDEQFFIDGFKIIPHSNYEDTKPIISLRCNPWFNQNNDINSYSIEADKLFFYARYTRRVVVSREFENLIIKCYPYDDIHPLLHYTIHRNEIATTIFYVTVPDILATVINNEMVESAEYFGLEKALKKHKDDYNFNWSIHYNSLKDRFRYSDGFGRRLELKLDDWYDDLRAFGRLETCYKKLATLVEEKK